MLVLEAKMQGRIEQFQVLDEAIRTFRFIQNSCLRFWIDYPGVSRNDLYKYCKVLADNPDFPWASQLNSQARQAAAERAWSAISRFFDNCKKQIPGKKGYPPFKRYQTHASLEYKTSGWKVTEDRNPKSLSTRTHVCPHCGQVQDRDQNAAINKHLEERIEYSRAYRSVRLGRDQPLSGSGR